MNLTGQPVRQKLPKPKRDRKHRQFVAQLPCLSCFRNGPGQAHHSRMGAYQLGKRVCDSRCVPLCPDCHADLHSGAEAGFWFVQALDPLSIAAQLYEASGDLEAGRAIVLEAKM